MEGGCRATEMLQGLGSRLVLGKEASLAVVDASLAWVFSRALHGSQRGIAGGIA